METKTKEITEKYAKLILRKCQWNEYDEYKKLEIMNTLMLFVKEMIEDSSSRR